MFSHPRVLRALAARGTASSQRSLPADGGSAKPGHNPVHNRRAYLQSLAFLAWPLGAGLLIALLWSITLAQTERDRQQAHAAMVQQAQSVSRAYAEQLRRTVAHVDQITLSLKYDWEDPTVILNLEKQRQRGLYPEDDQLYASVIDRQGEIVTSSLRSGTRHIHVQPDFFLHHMTDGRQDLLITDSNGGRRTPSPAIRFSRRIDTANGHFDGVALVAVEPAFLVSFYDEALLGAHDFITVRQSEGGVLATKLGQGSAAGEIYYRHDPSFATQSGVRYEAGEQFWDGHSRVVAWKKLEDYPLVAIAAMAESRGLAAFHANAARARAAAGAGTALLLVAAVIGMLLSRRLAWRRQQADEVKQSYRLAVDAAREGFYMLVPICDREGRAVDFEVADCNERAAQLIRMTRADLLGLRVSQIHSCEYVEAVKDRLFQALRTGYYEEEVRVPTGSRLQAAWVHRRIVRSGTGLAVTLRDVSDAREQQEALAAMANVDALTGLPNRHWLGNFLPRALEQARKDGSSLAVLFVDLDDFKNINDTMGHGCGDELLKAAALRLKSLVRASDHVVRLGGDEFTVVLQQVHRVEDVARIAHVIVHALGEPFTLAGCSSHAVQASVGISVFPEDGDDGATLLKHADIAMYAAKESGKGRYHFYHTQLSDRLMLRLAREQALRQAIERDQFVLHYQPRVDTASGRLLSVEALVRWIHPERGLVGPGEFIDIAEDTGLILRLGRMVIEKACAQIAQWKREGLPVVPVSINVSALQFNEGHVKDVLHACMHRYGIEPDLIGVELTESCMAGEGETVAGELDGLRALGIKLLVDDFGTGYSSLSQLQKLNVDILKVDRAFTLTLAESEEGKALFKAIVSMADALDIGIVAEGVETPEQLRVLQSLRCDEVQGHIVSRAVPAAEMAQLMIRRFLFPPGLMTARVATA